MVTIRLINQPNGNMEIFTTLIFYRSLSIMDRDTLINNILYEDMEDEEVFDLISRIDDSEVLHLIAINYNWDDGIEIPQMILDNKHCELATALTIFGLAEGFEYLDDKSALDYDKELKSFVTDLYERIINRKFIQGEIKYNPQLTKVQIYKLKKTINEDEIIFIETIGTKEVNEEY